MREIEAHREILAKVRRYEHVKHRLQVLVDLINELKTKLEAAAAGNEKKGATAAK